MARQTVSTWVPQHPALRLCRRRDHQEWQHCHWRSYRARQSRASEVRATVEQGGAFVLIHVATPLDVCEQWDCRGLYTKARAGLLPQFTGISGPYEVPTDAAVVLGYHGADPRGGRTRDHFASQA